MKKTLNAVPFILLAFMLLTVSAACAEGSMPSIDEQVENLSEKLTLTEEQKAAVRPLIETNRNNLKPLFESIQTKETRREKITVFRDIKKEQTRYREELIKILDDEQVKKYDAMLKERRESLKEYRKNKDTK